MEFIDVFAGKKSADKLAAADKLGIKIAPGHYSLFVSKDRHRIRQERRKTDFVAAAPKSKQEMNSLLTNTYYDFMIVSFPLGKRNVRMAKRYETAIAVPLAPAMSMRAPGLRKTRRNIQMVQEIGGAALLCSGAESAGEIRAGPELASIGVLLGMKPDLATKAVRQTPSSIVRRNEKLSRNPAWGVVVK